MLGWPSSQFSSNNTKVDINNLANKHSRCGIRLDNHSSSIKASNLNILEDMDSPSLNMLLSNSSSQECINSQLQIASQVMGTSSSKTNTISTKGDEINANLIDVKIG